MVGIIINVVYYLSWDLIKLNFIELEVNKFLYVLKRKLKVFMWLNEKKNLIFKI